MLHKVLFFIFLVCFFKTDPTYAYQLGIFNQTQEKDSKEINPKDPYSRDTPKGTVNGFF